MAYTISGSVTDGSAPVSGSTVRIYNQTLGSYVGKTISDANGDYDLFIAASTPVTGLHFEAASNDYCLIPHASYQNSSEFTIEFWFKRPSLTTRSWPVNKKGGGNNGWFIEIEPSGQIRWNHWGLAGYTSGHYITDTEWHHLAFVVKDNVSVEFFVDGVSVNSQSIGLRYDHTAQLALYELMDSVGQPYGITRPGISAELRFWDHARTATQINDNYHIQLCGDETGLAGYWRLDEIVSGEVIDYSTNNLNGTIGNTPVITTSDINLAPCSTITAKGLNFDGVDDYVNLGSPAELNITGTLTLEAWVNPDSLSGNPCITTWANPGYGGIPFHLVILEDGAIRLNRSGNADSNPGDVVTGQLQHIAVVHDTSTNMAYHYVDGVEVRSQSYNPSPATSNSFMSITRSDVQFMNGVISEARVWNTALTQQQIQDNMATTLCGDETGLVGYWRLDEITSGTVQDYSTNNNTGTLVSTPTAVNTGITLTPCGGGSSFDPTNNFHATCEFESGSIYYNSLSYPYIIIE